MTFMKFAFVTYDGAEARIRELCERFSNDVFVVQYLFFHRLFLYTYNIYENRANIHNRSIRNYFYR